ncbi:16988_t:CDS:2 [Dentiscutata heterogama]|uniref:16988_t:CDS:1 n=1 Tax=Dentiscutata heterogama TaxID=1316150 RepID=A0ACA9NBL2_9GLOM|nr:16988_t:CDS:2 [Dentiscutata heterogama]
MEVDEEYEPGVEKEVAFVTLLKNNQPLAEAQIVPLFKILADVNPIQNISQALVVLLTKPQQKRGLFIINQLELCDVAKDIISIRANVILGQLLQYLD